MSVDPLTVQHLALAERNQALARTLLAGAVRPVPAEWASVVAFYAAVHYVNAYLWERLRVKSRTHGERRMHVESDSRLAACRLSYRGLQHAGYLARYDVTFRQSEQRARELVTVELARVQRTVVVALGLPPTATT